MLSHDFTHSQDLPEFSQLTISESINLALRLWYSVFTSQTLGKYETTLLYFSTFALNNNIILIKDVNPLLINDFSQSPILSHGKLKPPLIKSQKLSFIQKIKNFLYTMKVMKYHSTYRKDKNDRKIHIYG